MRDCVLFDLDGTLINLDTDGFIEDYFKLLTYYFRDDIGTEKMAPVLKKAVYEMMTQVGDSNYDVFCKVFHAGLGVPDGTYEPKFQEFYEGEFDKLRPYVKQNPNMQQAVGEVRDKGYKLALATNPAFPMVAQKKRLSWGGYHPEDFALITACDNSNACKPTEEYYREIAQKLGVSPESCTMIGNDVDDDMAAGNYGLDTFLVTDCLVNKSGSAYNGKTGKSGDFLKLAKELPSCSAS